MCFMVLTNFNVEFSLHTVDSTEQVKKEADREIIDVLLKKDDDKEKNEKKDLAHLKAVDDALFQMIKEKHMADKVII